MGVIFSTAERARVFKTKNGESESATERVRVVLSTRERARVPYVVQTNAYVPIWRCICGKVSTRSSQNHPFSLCIPLLGVEKIGKGALILVCNLSIACYDAVRVYHSSSNHTSAPPPQSHGQDTQTHLPTHPPTCRLPVFPDEDEPPLQLGVEERVDGLLGLYGGAVLDDAAALGPPGDIPHHVRSNNLFFFVEKMYEVVVSIHRHLQTTNPREQAGGQELPGVQHKMIQYDSTK